MTGGASAQKLLGLAGDDTLVGLGGADSLRGEQGADVLDGGTGADVLIGGSGPDRFDFNSLSASTPAARDAIRAGDGEVAMEGVGGAGGDLIDLAGIDASATLAGDLAFVLGSLGNGGLSLVDLGEDTRVCGNVDDDAPFELELLIADGTVPASAYLPGISCSDPGDRGRLPGGGCGTRPMPWPTPIPSRASPTITATCARRWSRRR